MERITICGFLLCFFLLTASVISFATKGVMLRDAPNGRYYQELIQPEIYRSLEGLISIDAFLVLFSVVSMVAICKVNTGVLHILEILLVLTLVARFVLGVTFLAGDDNYCKDVVQRYEDFTDAQRSSLSESDRDYYVTLRGAWIYEIINICMTDILGTGIFFVFLSRGKGGQ